MTAIQPVEAPGAVTAIQPVEAPGAVTAIQPVEAPGAVTAIQPVEAPGAVTATQPVEAPGASSEMLFTSQDSSLPSVLDNPTAHAATATKKSAMSLSSSRVPAEELAADTQQLSDRASSYADEGEVSDLESSGPDQEELLDVNLELSAEQTYREAMHGVRSFVVWNDIPEFDSSSSSQSDNPFTGSQTSHTGKMSVKVPLDDWLYRKFEKLNLTFQEGYPSHKDTQVLCNEL